VVVTPLHAAARELGQLAASILSGDGAVEHYEHSTLALDEEGRHSSRHQRDAGPEPNDLGLTNFIHLD
jgi:hypothetical protein